MNVPSRSEADRAAAAFMAQKGLSHVEPQDVRSVATSSSTDNRSWRYLYDLGDGTLELLVSWVDGEWDWVVANFDGP